MEKTIYAARARRDRDPVAAVIVVAAVQNDDEQQRFSLLAPVIVHHVINDRQSFSVSYMRIPRAKKKKKEGREECKEI